MRNPLKAIDSWASQSGDRASLLLWLLIFGMALMVVIAMAGLYLYTAPLAPR